MATADFPGNEISRDILDLVIRNSDSKWKELARRLPIASTLAECVQEIKQIEDACPGDLKGQCNAMLVKWSTESTAATAAHLVQCLQSIGQNRLVPHIVTMKEEIPADIIKLITEIAADKWRYLAHKLPISPTLAERNVDIKQIEDAYPGDLKGQCNAMLVKWSTESTAATAAHLVQCLQSIGQNRLAEHIHVVTMKGQNSPGVIELQPSQSEGLAEVNDQLLFKIARYLNQEGVITSAGLTLGIPRLNIAAAISNNANNIYLAALDILIRWYNANSTKGDSELRLQLIKMLIKEDLHGAILQCRLGTTKDVAENTLHSRTDSNKNQAVERHFLEKAMKEGKAPVYRGRIMLVGHSGAGKTHLLKNLIHSTYNEEEHKLTNGIETECTVSVDITTSDFNTDVPSDKKVFEKEILSISDKVRDKVREARTNIEEGSHDIPEPSEPPAMEFKTEVEESVLNKTPEELRQSKNTNPRKLFFWDFGGQVVFYTTHQTFLTESGIYLLVLDLSKGLDEEIETRIQTSEGDKIKATSVPQTSLKHQKTS